ncbi:universal stress protein [Roseateles amylovorans]|jgi:nucleotide-binding universal stress UspA family protein|uniref:Universal stress protein n=1 Tax=Roseateles amylovorans TaxID=2978473 RepID=A0ABY6B5N6_9BURK|nr:universal stress protein [Roseateles amylovorans]UXH79628.1 universal stress protein [Roseateles amylovorans]
MVDTILVPIDGSAAADFGFQQALALARPLNARLVLLHVVDVEPMFLQGVGDLKDYRKNLRDYGEEILATAAVAAQDQGVQVSYYLRETVESSPASTIVAEAVRQHCGLIVMGTHGRRRLSRLALGGDAELVLRDSTVPVMFVRAPAKTGLGTSQA